MKSPNSASARRGRLAVGAMLASCLGGSAELCWDLAWTFAAVSALAGALLAPDIVSAFLIAALADEVAPAAAAA